MNTFKCNLCPRSCSAIRSDGYNNGGFCKLPSDIIVARAGIHNFEEPSISGINGSGTVFFSGCQLGCIYCQNEKISHENFGKSITSKELADIFKRLEETGVHNINLVSPTPHTEGILEALSVYKPAIPIVYNSGGYETRDTLLRYKDFVDIFLLDYKYSDDNMAWEYSQVKNYSKYALESVKTAIELVGKPQYFSDGIMKKGVIVRHLLLPFGTNNAMGVIDALTPYKDDIVFSLMNQYTVMPKAQNNKKLHRKVTLREYDKVSEYMISRGFDGYLQSGDSSDKKFIPDFDLSGI